MAKTGKERALDRKLIDVYDKYGLKTFVNVCSQMLNVKDRQNWEKKKKVNGEVCEVVLRVLTEHFLSEYGIKGNVFHSLVLGNKQKPSSPFRTELDFTLVTPTVCLTGECKSYVGNITVTDRCTLQRDTLVSDVARQSDVHVTALKPYLEDFALEGVGVPVVPVLPFCFLYSNGSLRDCRGRKVADQLPVLTLQTLFNYYSKVFNNYRVEVYDVKKATKTFQAMADSKILHIQHARYLGYN